MTDDAKLIRDPDFLKLLKRRSRWRWGFSALLIGAYLLYGVLGVYMKDAYAAPFLGSALPVGMALGLVIILLSIALSILYVRIVNVLEGEETREQERHR
jgi:uncharacterized membrane protein (DUF485 family)